MRCSDKGRVWRCALATLIMVALMLGCQDGSVTRVLAPSEPGSHLALQKGGPAFVPDAGQLKWRTTHNATTAWAKISAATGGAFSNGDFAMSVPPGALSRNSKMSITVIAGDYLTADFGPDGTFKTPVTLTISYKNADLKNIDQGRLRMKWYDTSSRKWVKVQGTVDTANQTVTAEVWHFTQYTVSTE